MQIAVVPTVFIAIGGTGHLIVKRLRQRLAQRIGTADIPFFRYVYVDSQQDAVLEATQGLTGAAAGWSAGNVVSPSENTLRNVQNPNLDNGRVARALDIDSWFDQHARNQLGTVHFAQGVGGRRMFSRLGFLASQNLGSFEQILIQYYNELITCSHLSGQQLTGIDPPYLNVTPYPVRDEVRFIVVTSAGGGTGSGCFIDLGFFLRKLRREHKWNHVHQYGIAALARPGVETPQQQRNSAALLTEMDHYDGTATYNAHYLTLANSPTFSDRNPPYDATYLVSATQRHRPLKGERAAAFDDLLWRVAEYLLNDTVGTFADADQGVPPDQVKLPRSGPVGSVAFQGDFRLNPPGLQTLGVSCREWPAAFVHKHLYSQAMVQVARGWVSPQPARCEAVLQSLRDRLGLPEPSVQQNNDPRSPDDPLKQALLRPCNEIDPLRQLQRMKGMACDDKGRLDPAQFVKLQGALKQQFVQRAGLPTNADAPGVVWSILQANLNELNQLGGPASLPRAVVDELLALCLDVHGGPASAAQVASDLRGVVNRELKFIQVCLDEVSPQAPDRPQRIEQCWQYANDMLLQHILQAKKTVYLTIEPWLEKLATRFTHFVTYLQSWAEQLSVSVEPLPTEVPSLVLPLHVVQQLERSLSTGIKVELKSLQSDRIDAVGMRRPGLLTELHDLIARGLPARDEAGRPTLFAEGVPTERGAPDYSYLRSLERAVFDAIGRSPASPYTQSVLDLLAQEANRTSKPFPNLLEEAELLINFESGDPDYSRQSFGGHPTHLAEIVQPHQPGFPIFEPAQIPGKVWLVPWSSVGRIKEVSVHQHVSPALSPFTVCYVSERCSIQTQHIAGYDLSQRRVLFGLDVFPAMSDRRIRLAPDAAALRRALVLFLGSVMIRQWTYLGGNQPYHQFVYTVQDAATGFARERTYFASHELNAATRNLADSPEVMSAIETKVQSYLTTSMGAAASDLLAAYQAVNALTQGKSPALVGDLHRWNLFGVHYEGALGAFLEFARTFGIPLPAPDHPYAEWADAGSPVPGNPATPAPQSGWYCRRCGHGFGANMPVRSGDNAQCPVCRNPNPRPAADSEGVHP